MKRRCTLSWTIKKYELVVGLCRHYQYEPIDFRGYSCGDVATLKQQSYTAVSVYSINTVLDMRNKKKF